MRKKKIYDDDDGRTIADMSGVGVPSPIFGGIRENPQQEETENPSQSFDMTRQERGAFILGAIGAGLLIALAFILGLGLAILLMILLWSH